MCQHWLGMTEVTPTVIQVLLSPLGLGFLFLYPKYLLNAYPVSSSPPDLSFWRWQTSYVKCTVKSESWEMDRCRCRSSFVSRRIKERIGRQVFYLVAKSTGSISFGDLTDEDPRNRVLRLGCEKNLVSHTNLITTVHLDEICVSQSLLLMCNY